MVLLAKQVPRSDIFLRRTMRPTAMVLLAKQALHTEIAQFSQELLIHHLGLNFFDNL
jgi:hypothetical protein